MSPSTDVTIREATEDDAAALLVFLRALFSEEERFGPITIDEFTKTEEEEKQFLRDFATRDNSIFFVAEQDGQLVGTCSLKAYSFKEMHHNVELGMSVGEKWRGQGIGRAILQHAIDWATAHPIVENIELSVYSNNTRALHLYRTSGFSEIGRRPRFIRRGKVYIDDVIMHKTVY
jgi:RimJ/RimL family protein N-acetyltransferase